MVFGSVVASVYVLVVLAVAGRLVVVLDALD